MPHIGTRLTKVIKTAIRNYDIATTLHSFDSRVSFHNSFQVLRLILFIGILLRFNLYPHVVVPTRAVAVCELIFLVYVLAVYVLSKRGGKIIHSRKLSIIQISLDASLFSLFIYLGGNIDSDIYISYMLPLFVAAEYLSSILNVLVFIAISIVYFATLSVLATSTEFIVGAFLPRFLFFSIISLGFMRLRQMQRARKDTLESILSGIGCGLVILDVDWRILYMNYIQKIYTPRAQIGQICYKAYSSQAQEEPCVWCPVVKTRESGGPYIGIAHYSDGTGKIRDYLEISGPIKNETGKAICSIVACSDITEELTESRILEEARYGVSIISRDLRVQYMNAVKRLV